ncbi:MAG TPA: MFS transporter [Solirubrobacteraceae bacterium]|nr:MFS transporter [Solirubrobacteraceae bacterium]
MAVSTSVRCGDWLDARTGRAGTGHAVEAARTGFWIVAAVFVVIQAGGTLPIPLYVIWQPRFGFGPGVLTLIFAVYALGTLFALLLISPLSDELGRRPALTAAIAFSAASTGVFLIANSIAALLAARFLSGIASGIVAASAAAALAELEPQGRSRRASLTATAANLGGLGFGTLFAGIVAQYGHDPTKLVFSIYLGVLVPTLLGLALVPETVRRPDDVQWRLQGLQVPAKARHRFALVGGAIFCAYTLNGLFSSLVPSFLAGSLHEHNHAIAGAIAASIFLIAAIAQLMLHRLTPRTALSIGMVMLLLSLAVIELALWDGSLAAFLAGTLAGAIAVGLTFMGGLATVNLIAEPEHRAQVVAAFLSCAFAGLTIPAVSVGIASQSIGTKDATLYCAVVIGALAAVALTATRHSQDVTEVTPA